VSRCEMSDRLDEFALGSMSEADRLRVLEHISTCPECAREAGDHLEALSSLALAVDPQEPPRSLSQVILIQATQDVARAHERVGSSARPDWSRWGMAAAAAIAVASFAWSIRLNNELEVQRTALANQSRRYDTIVGVLAANRVKIQAMSATDAAPGSMGRIFLDQETGSGMVMHRLPPLGTGQCYQLWFAGHGERKSGGVLRTNPDGSGYTIIQAPGPVSNFDTVGVTREPEGGSEWPTSDRLLGAGI
jgi:anti-sigma-K factor RskA